MHNHFIDKLAVIVGFISGFALFPQAYAIVASNSADNVAMSTWVIIFVNSIVWLIYAIHRQLIALVVPSVFNLVACAAVIWWYFTI